jgi:ParB/RepB/Spo0J family partition protein
MRRGRVDELRIDAIDVPDGRLEVDEAVVKDLMESIKKLGLLNPITVRRPPSHRGLKLVAGQSRLEACKRLGMKEIDCYVTGGDKTEEQEEIDEWCKRAEIDENVSRRELSPAQRQALIEQRHMSAAEIAARALERSPEKSDRAIAAEAGVSPETVRRSRKSVATNVATEKRVGKDGKKYKAKKPKKPKQSEQSEEMLLPYQEPCEDCTNENERWERSVQAFAADAMRMEAFWEQ